MNNVPLTETSKVVFELRKKLGITQSKLASQASIDQSRLSRLERCEQISADEIDAVLESLIKLGSPEAAQFIDFSKKQWYAVQPPSFWNPERAALEITDETIEQIDGFLGDDEQAFLLKRQIQQRRTDLVRASNYLSQLKHNIAFIGDIGVGKSTAISFIFDLLVPPKPNEPRSNQPVLETGAGGTTICEVHIKNGPEFGITIQPMDYNDLISLVSDFCSGKWTKNREENTNNAEIPGVSQEVERAIRNMSGFRRTRKKGADGKAVSHDELLNLIKECDGEDQFRTQIIHNMELPNRTTTEMWYKAGTSETAQKWLRETFKHINNGRIKDVPLPKSITLMLPDFDAEFGDFEITVIDTKGVNDVAVREDLDLHLKDPRTSIVLCSRFNDAPGTSSKALLQHMVDTVGAPLDSGKVSVLVLPRTGEAKEMKDDMGNRAYDDEDGYEMKFERVSGELASGGLSDVPMVFYNIDTDSAQNTRDKIFKQLSKMRCAISERLFDLCAASTEIMENQEKHEATLALQEVARQLNNFLRAGGQLGSREKHAYEETLRTVRSVRYASTLWAATRRNGIYSGLNFIHQIGIGSAKDARLRSETWFTKLDGFLNTLQEDENLVHAKHSITQISVVAKSARLKFIEQAQRAAMEIYRPHLTNAAVWSECESEWGRGPGFTDRVIRHLQSWFEKEATLKEKLDNRLNVLWEKIVISPLIMHASEEEADNADADNIVRIPITK